MEKDNKPYLICCGVLQQEMERLIAGGYLSVEPVYLDVGLHAEPEKLKEQLVKAIDRCSADGPRPIIVVYGDLCYPGMKQLIGNYANVTKVDALNCIDCLLGGHGQLCSIDPNWEYFYLSPGWLPSSLKASPVFRSLFDNFSDQHKAMLGNMKGIIVFDTLDDPDGFRAEVEEFAGTIGLPVTRLETIGLEGLKSVVSEAMPEAPA